ncbi:MAG: hypothetical protein HC840_26405 [Leptolyngbyaceae cyanobacterium RM2_2_4]|nr:hypothetical protein [Leptolyngbyaceae cyanobacterium RM2_2_4]
MAHLILLIVILGLLIVNAGVAPLLKSVLLFNTTLQDSNAMFVIVLG